MPPGSILMEEKMKHQHLSQHRQRSLTLALAIVVIPVLLLTGSSRAQDIYAYPAKGQSQAQQDRDRYECHSWAAKQTGFDPSKSQAVTSDTPAASNQRMPAQGHVVRGAGRGAALGAVGGAITGDAGTGAAAGAAMGALAGGMRRRQLESAAATGDFSSSREFTTKPTHNLPSCDGGVSHGTRLHRKLGRYGWFNVLPKARSQPAT